MTEVLFVQNNWYFFEYTHSALFNLLDEAITEIKLKSLILAQIER